MVRKFGKISSMPTARANCHRWPLIAYTRRIWNTNTSDTQYISMHQIIQIRWTHTRDYQVMQHDKDIVGSPKLRTATVYARVVRVKFQEVLEVLTYLCE